MFLEGSHPMGQRGQPKPVCADQAPAPLIIPLQLVELSPSEGRAKLIEAVVESM
jgi:hypothetical protein